MKKIILEFINRGLVACGFGPLVLAVIYLILKHNGVIETLTVDQVCMGIFTLTALAFIVGGMNIIYQIERLPLMIAILIHGTVLYISYLATYLLNDWLQAGFVPIVVFTVIFVVGYIAIWIIICILTKRNTAKINKIIKEKQGQG